jgi:hypothetical protein
LAGFSQSNIVTSGEKALASFLSLVKKPESKILVQNEDSEQTYILEDALKECDVFDEAIDRAFHMLRNTDMIDDL